MLLRIGEKEKIDIVKLDKFTIEPISQGKIVREADLLFFNENSLNVGPLHNISLLSVETVIKISSLFITTCNLYII